MAQDGIRAQMEAHWRAFDALADSQTRGNETIVRALEVFEGARGSFTAEQAAANNPAAAAAAARFPANMMFGRQQQQHQQHQQNQLYHQQYQHGGGEEHAPPRTSFPRGTANAGTSDDAARRAYFRAEEALVLAREQLERNEETLQRMVDEVERARARIGASYNTEDVGSRQERVDVRATASLQALDRGDSGCAMSPVEMARAMAGLLRMHQSEFEMQESIVCGLGYNNPGENVTVYREALGLRPLMDGHFRSEAQEIRELSQELENPGSGL